MVKHFGGLKVNKKTKLLSTVALQCVKDISTKQVDEVLKEFNLAHCW
jgi:hypothetical protein